ncbi:MAG TPA: inner membrane CreD family protein [Gemmatimonadaceae bacterium]|nr:inner membrane CreD family protein [Gemmatimonadaceae bacterium]
MTRRIIAIAFIFVVTSAAWLALGATIFARTHQSQQQLTGRVSSTWGSRQAQPAPLAYTLGPLVGSGIEPAPATVEGRPVPAMRDATTTTRQRDLLPLEQTRARVDFQLDHRRKGLLWYSTYAVAFDGSFNFRNTTASDSVVFEFPLPASQAIYDDIRMLLNGVPVEYAARGQSLVTSALLGRGQIATLAVAYRSHGLDEWRYVLGSDVSAARDFELVMRTDFAAIDFPENTLSPTDRRRSGDGWELRWRYSSLLSGFQIGMDMPRKLQPGPLAGRIAFFAPVSLLFFFAVMFIITTLRRIDLHPMNYAFLAAAFFAFHLLMSYLVDHISIHLAFLISSAVSIALVVSYLRLAVGPRFAFREAAAAQFIYLVLFSYAFFFEGFTGLAITIGSIVTLFVAMQLTGRIRWSEVFAADAQSRAR